MSGCTNLIIREGDDGWEKTGKVLGRTFLGITTLTVHEWFIQDYKSREIDLRSGSGLRLSHYSMALAAGKPEIDLLKALDEDFVSAAPICNRIFRQSYSVVYAPPFFIVGLAVVGAATAGIAVPALAAAAPHANRAAIAALGGVGGASGLTSAWAASIKENDLYGEKDRAKVRAVQGKWEESIAAYYLAGTSADKAKQLQTAVGGCAAYATTTVWIPITPQSIPPAAPPTQPLPGPQGRPNPSPNPTSP